MQIVVVGGGTGTNAVAPVFAEAAYTVTYVVPTSDNGGSTSEVLRLFGGPAIGDARSRLVRLIDPSPLRTLLALRLSDNAELAARDWAQIVDGSHGVWREVPPYMKAMYRAFLVHVHAELLKRTTTTKPFDFRHASIGNLLLTGARLFFGTLEAAIEFVLHTTLIPRRFAILPCLNSNFSLHIAANLHNGELVIGQSAISHPTHDSGEGLDPGANELGDLGEDGFVHPSLRQSQLSFAKDATPPLPSAIERVFYVNLFGTEIRPSASPRVVTSLQTADAVVLSVGSLYTSIIPVLLLQGFAVSMPRRCILMLNGSADRETAGMAPADHLAAVNRAFAYSSDSDRGRQYVTAVIHPEDMDVSGVPVHCEPAMCIEGEYNLGSLSKALKKCLALPSQV